MCPLIICLLLLSLTAAPAHAGSIQETCDNGGADWCARAARTISALEYCISMNDRGLQAPNRMHDVRTYFRDEGIVVEPRRATAAPWSWSWTTNGIGRAMAIGPVAPAALVHDGARAEYRRGNLVESYDNSEAGLRQSFVLEEPPLGSGPVCLVGTIERKLPPADAGADPMSSHVSLSARDATDRPLPAAMTLAGNTGRILVDDAGAVYPLLIERELLDSTWYRDSDQASAGLGIGLSPAGDVNGDGFGDIVMAAPYYDAGQVDEGRVFVFYGSAGGPAGSPWMAEGNRANAWFGYSVSTAGDVNKDGYHDIIVGAPGYDNGDGTVGRVFAFHGRAQGMGGAIMWYARGPATSTMWGAAVSTAGDVNGDGYDDIVFGAFRYTADQAFEGRTYLHLGSSDGLADDPAWFTDGNSVSSYYGKSVAAAGDVDADGYDDILVGAGRFNGSAVGCGRAFLYRGSPAGPATVPDWYEDGENALDEFATSVAGAGDVNGDGYADVVVGAPKSNASQPEGGRAYVYLGSHSGPESTPAWFAGGEHTGAHFGACVAPAGDVNGDGYGDVLVGAPDLSDDQSEEGRVRLYYGSMSGLEPDPRWWCDGNQVGAHCGTAAATAGDVNGDGFSDLLIAAPDYDGGLTDEGRVWLYDGMGDGPKRNAGWVIESNQANARFGAAVANAGDVNGDGFEDLLVGAPFYDNGQADEGAAFLFLGHAAGPSVLPDWYAESNQAGAEFGAAVAGNVDVNGDGYDDFLIGAPSYNGTFANSGRAFLWLGSAAGGPPGTPGNAAWWAGNGHGSMDFARAVASAGDVNGDGYGDVIIGAPNSFAMEPEGGEAFVYHGSETGLESTASWRTAGEQTAGHLGFAVSCAGDIGGDGFSDILIGEPDHDHDIYVDMGWAYVYEGSPAGLPPERTWFSPIASDGAHFGFSVASAGDLNGDGFSDILIGGPGDDWGALQNVGSALIYLCAPGGVFDLALVATSLDPQSQIGFSVAPAGDVNGDGYSDLVIGGPGHPNPDTGAPRTGSIWYMPGCEDPPGCIGDSDYLINGNQTDAFFGCSVAAADVNGDGFSDLIAGAMYHDQGQVDEGRTFLFYGNEGRGLARIPNQMRTDFSAPIALLGLSDHQDGFGLRARGRSAAGRTHVWMEWEVKPFGTPFDGSGTGSGAVRDTGAPQPSLGSFVLLDQPVTGVLNDPTHHWRLRIASRNPYFPRTPWFSPPGATEMDLRTTAATAVADEGAAWMSHLSLDSRPNPFATSTVIRYGLPAASVVEVAVYDLSGRHVRTLAGGRREAGIHNVYWDGRGDHGRRLASGVYWVRIRTAAGETSHRLLLLD